MIYFFILWKRAVFAKDETTLKKLTQQASKYGFATAEIMEGANRRRKLSLPFICSYITVTVPTCMRSIGVASFLKSQKSKCTLVRSEYYKV